MTLAALLSNQAAAASASDHAGQAPHLVLVTDVGSIDIELYPDAAPSAVARIVRLAEGPVFAAEVSDDGPHAPVVGYYDGLELDYALPGSFLATAVRPPRSAALIATEIDADALGLDRRTITSGTEASDVWQFQLLPHQARARSNEAAQSLMKQWLEQWGETFSADFLVGVSWKEVNEALGYSYVGGLASRHVTRGTVSLEPYDVRWSTPRLVIALRDMPEKDGRQMVVGRVVSGLELADKVAARPLTPVKAAQFRPLVPVRILETRVEWRTYAGAESSVASSAKEEPHE